MEDHELDRWLAENVMEWVTLGSFYAEMKLKRTRYHPIPIILIELWNPTRSIEQAFQVVEKMTETHSFVLFGGSAWIACFTDDDGFEAEREAVTPALAICLAARKAKQSL